MPAPVQRRSRMADYVLLYSGGSMPETKEEQDAVMAAWNAWFDELGGALKDDGNPFTPTAKSIAPDGSVTDGSAGPGERLLDPHGGLARRGDREGQGLPRAEGRRLHHGVRDLRGDVAGRPVRSASGSFRTRSSRSPRTARKHRRGSRSPVGSTQRYQGHREVYPGSGQVASGDPFDRLRIVIGTEQPPPTEARRTRPALNIRAVAVSVIPYARSRRGRSLVAGCARPRAASGTG